MSSGPSDDLSVLDQILSSDDREVKLLVAQGMFPLPPQELVPIQLALLRDSDVELAAAARESLESLEPRIAASVAADASDSSVIFSLAAICGHPVVIEAVLRNRVATGEGLAELAGTLSGELQEVLLLRQDLIIDAPLILDRLEQNPELTSYAQRRIHEYRQHLLQPVAEPQRGEGPAEDVETAVEEATDEEVEQAIAQVRDLPASGERDEVTGLSEAQIRSLPVPVRMKLARGAPRTLRGILIKDKSTMVAAAVLNGNALTESEIELIASNRSVSEEVLGMIAKNRQWNRKYNITHALVRNPRTSVGLAVRLVSRLSIRDLRNLSRDRNVSEAVRNTAARLYRIKAV